MRRVIAGRPSSRLALLAMLAFPALLAPRYLCAQGLRFPSAEPQQDTVRVVSEGPAAIPIAEVPLRAEDALARMRGLEMQVGTDPDVRIIESDLPNELAAISSAHQRVGRIIPEHLSLRELRVLTEIWRGHEDRLAGWGGTFEHEWVELQAAGEAVSDIRADWELTRDSAAAGEAPVEVMDRIESVVDATESLDNALRDELAYLLGLESQLTDALDGVRQVLRELEDAQVSVRGRIWLQNHPPLWRLAGFEDESASTVAARLWREDWQATKRFLAENQGRLFGSVLIFLFLLVGAARLRSRIETEDFGADEALRGAVETLSRPVSAAVLITLILANAVFPRAPMYVWEVIAALTVVPLYRLLPASSNRLVNRTMRALLLLFAVGAIGDLLLPPSLEHRIFTLSLGIAMVAGSVGLLRGVDPDTVGEGRWGRAVWRGLRLTAVVASIAVIASALGWTLLAEMLVFGTLASAYAALLLVVGYRVLVGIIRLVPYSIVGQASHIISNYGDVISERAVRLLKLTAAALWFWLVLEIFYLSGPVYRWLEGLFTGSLQVGIIEFSLGKIFGFVAVLLLTVWIARFVRFVLDVEILPRLKLKRGVGNAVSTVVQWIILGLGLLTAAGALGLGAQQLAIVAGALGVGIGFGLQNIVNNFVSGLILIFEQPVKVGDKIEISSLALTGEVRKIGIRSSVVRTFEGAEVIVPNANLISSEVINWTLSDQRRRVRVEVGVAYGTDPALVVQTLKEVAANHPEVLRYPEPFVIFVEFGDSSLNFRLMFWTATFDDFFRVRSEMYVAVHDALEVAGITIPFPQRDLHVKSIPDGSAAIDDGS